MILSREDMETRMKRLVRQQMMMNRILEFDESVAALRGVTDSAVEGFARQCLRRDAFSLLAYGSRKLNGLRGFDFSFPDGGSRGSPAPENARNAAQPNARNTAQT